MSPAVESGIHTAANAANPQSAVAPEPDAPCLASEAWEGAPQKLEDVPQPATPSLASETEAAAPQKPAQSVPHLHHHHSLLQAFQSLLYVIVVALFIITFTAQPFRIPSESMEPTLLVGDFLLVDKQVGLEVPPRIFAPSDQIHRGDLIVFHYPVDASLHLVKRVVGLPGDHLRLRDGRVFIDGRPIPEPYAVFRPAAPDSYRDDFPRIASANPGVTSRWWIQMRSLVANGELTIPSDSYFVLGDNRNDSEDSRYWGFVPRDAIVGKPFLIYFSLNLAAPTVPSAQAQPYAAPSPENPAIRPDRPGSFFDFARWDRTLRIIH
jgi:signal peptidase I